MQYLHRIIEKKIRSLSGQFPAILISGPRQVGKTTLLKNIAEKQRKYISFDDLSLRELAQNDPKLFLREFKPPLILDEIQYVPELLPYIKLEIDNSRKNGMYWLTGSQHFHLMKNVSESLAGRIAVISLLGFSQKEINKNFKEILPFIPGVNLLKSTKIAEMNDSFKQIFYGSMPIPNTQKDIDLDVFFNSYLQTYLLRDLRELAQVSDLSKFTRFIKMCAARTGQLLNYSDLARDTDISVPTAKNWLSVLENSYIIYLLQPYHSNISKRLIKSPKLYFTDTGFCSYLTSWSSPKTLMNGAMSGAIFETYIITEILKSYWNQGKQAPLFFYRDKDGKEIDLIIENDNTLHPVEIKISATVRKEWVKHFPSLKNLNKPIGMGAVICLTDRNQYINENNIAINSAQV